MTVLKFKIKAGGDVVAAFQNQPEAIEWMEMQAKKYDDCEWTLES